MVIGPSWYFSHVSFYDIDYGCYLTKTFVQGPCFFSVESLQWISYNIEYKSVKKPYKKDLCEQKEYLFFKYDGYTKLLSISNQRRNSLFSSHPQDLFPMVSIKTFHRVTLWIWLLSRPSLTAISNYLCCNWSFQAQCCIQFQS